MKVSTQRHTGPYKTLKSLNLPNDGGSGTVRRLGKKKEPRSHRLGLILEKSRFRVRLSFRGDPGQAGASLLGGLHRVVQRCPHDRMGYYA